MGHVGPGLVSSMENHSIGALKRNGTTISVLPSCVTADILFGNAEIKVSPINVLKPGDGSHFSKPALNPTVGFRFKPHMVFNR